jgi:hypothetical protein
LLRVRNHTVVAGSCAVSIPPRSQRQARGMKPRAVC